MLGMVKVVPSPVQRHRSGVCCDTVDRLPRIPLPLLLRTGVAVLSSPARTPGCVTVLRRASALSACRAFRPACDPALAGTRIHSLLGQVPIAPSAPAQAPVSVPAPRVLQPPVAAPVQPAPTLAPAPARPPQPVPIRRSVHCQRSCLRRVRLRARALVLTGPVGVCEGVDAGTHVGRAQSFRFRANHPYARTRCRGAACARA